MRKSAEDKIITANDIDIVSLVDSIKDSYKKQEDFVEETYEMQQDSIKETAKVQKESMNEVSGYYKEMIGAGLSGVKDSSKQAIDMLSNHSREVLGSGLTEIYDLSKKMALSLGGGIKRMWDIRQENKKDRSEEFLEDIADSQKEFTKEATTGGSIYTHDITLEKILGDSTKVVKDQKNILSNVQNIIDKGTEMAVKSKNILEKALDMLYDRSDREEKSGFDILELVASILNSLNSQAADIQLMRINQVEQMGALQKLYLPIQQSYFKYFRDSARGTEIVANRLVEIRRILSQAYGISEESVAVADKGWKFFGKVILGPLLILKWYASNIFKKITDNFKKDDKQLTDSEKRNSLLFDILKSINKLSPINKTSKIKMGDGRVGDTVYKRESGQGIKDMTKMIDPKKLYKSSEQQTEILESLQDYFLRKEKEEARTKDPKKKFPWLSAIFAMGALIGGAIGALLLPFTLLFEVLTGATKIFKKIWGVMKTFKPVAFALEKISIWFTKLSTVIRKLPGMDKVFKTFEKIGVFFGKIGSIFKKIGGISAIVLEFIKKIPIVGNFLKGLLWGFKALALPFRLVFMVIDFIKGFIKTEGGLVDRIKGGLKEVVKGFLELPVKLIGWVVDWFLGLIGVQKPEGGSAQVIMDGIMKAVDVALDIIIWPFKKVYSWLQNILATGEEKPEDVSILSKIGWALLGIGKKVIDLVLSIVPLFKAYWNNGFSGMWEYIKTNWLGMSGETKPEELPEKPKSDGETLTSKIWGWVKTLCPMIGVLSWGFGSLWEYIKTNWLGMSGETKPEELPEKPKSDGKSMTENLWNWLLENNPLLKTFIEDGVVGVAKLVGSNMVNTGKGIVKGAKSALDWVTSPFKSEENKENKESKNMLEETAKSMSELTEQATTHKGGHSLFVNVMNYEILASLIENVLKKFFEYSGYSSVKADDYSQLQESIKSVGAFISNGVSKIWDATKSTANKIVEWSGIGSISEKYESGGRGAGTVSSGKGDLGGASYGTYQLSSKMGTLQSFLKSSGYDEFFKNLMPGTKEFNKTWKDIASKDTKGFGQAQHDFIKRTHFDPIAEMAKEMGIDVNDKATQEALWSLGVQHGVGGGKNILKNALSGADISKMSNEDIINSLYSERGKRNASGDMAYFKNSSKEIQESVAKRFHNEKSDVLGISRKPSNRVETAKADGEKIIKDDYNKQQEQQTMRDMEAKETTRVLKMASMKQDKYQQEMSKQKSINNSMIVSGGGGNREINDIPEFNESHLLGLISQGIA